MRDDQATGRQLYIVAGLCKSLGVDNPINQTVTVGQANRVLRELRKEVRTKNGQR